MCVSSFPLKVKRSVLREQETGKVPLLRLVLVFALGYFTETRKANHFALGDFLLSVTRRINIVKLCRRKLGHQKVSFSDIPELFEVMDKEKLRRIYEELESSEVAALSFLCCDVVNKKQLEEVCEAKDLFFRLEDIGLLSNEFFLSRLLHTIRRADLLSLLSRQPQEANTSPNLSAYRVMLFKIYEDMTQKNFEKLKSLMREKLGTRNTETCKTALDLFAEMEKAGSLSNKNLTELQTVLMQFNQKLALIVQRYIDGITLEEHTRLNSLVNMDDQRVNHSDQPSYEQLVDVEPLTNSSSLSDESREYYALNKNLRGLCVVINNEEFEGTQLTHRKGSHQDEMALCSVFTHLGFTMVIHNNLTADAMRRELQLLGENNFLEHDALVVCVLSHGDNGCVYGTDEKKVLLRELTQPFTSGRAPTLAGKPKLFFIEASQGDAFQKGSMPYLPKPAQDDGSHVVEGADHVPAETVPSDADFLLGMATVPECKTFRNTATGCIYIQELCRQLMTSAKSSTKDDILSVLTRVNREVSKGAYLNYKQMPEPKYTLTKKLVLKCVS